MPRAYNRLIGSLDGCAPQDVLDYGAFLVYETEKDGSRPQAEVIETNSEDGNRPTTKWTVYRFDLDRCTFVDGVLSDNPYHPDSSVWWDVDSLASFTGIGREELITAFCSADPVQRAWAYKTVVDYHGVYELDQDPITFTSRSEVYARYVPALRRLRARESRKRQTAKV